MVIAWTLDSRTGVGHTLVDNTELVVAAKLREPSAIIELAGAITRPTRGAWAALCDRADFHTISGDAGCCIAFASRCAVDVETRIDEAEVFVAAEEALRAGEFAILARECALAVGAARTGWAQRWRFFVDRVVAIVIEAIANFDARSGTARADEVSADALQYARQAEGVVLGAAIGNWVWDVLVDDVIAVIVEAIADFVRAHHAAVVALEHACDALSGSNAASRAAVSAAGFFIDVCVAIVV